ncbi:MAG: competence protein ComEA [Thermoanaerobacteraceae bacterium]|nr:competence protein ComEA [Thermoanaerobacteraceae bacterium]
MFDFSKREKILLGLLLVLIISVISISYYAFFKEEPEIAFKLQEEPVIPVTAPIQAQKIVVHVAGAVKNPGVYTLEEGQRVKDAIEIAGGPLPEADLLKLNLAQKIHDEDKLYVPKIGETAEKSEQENASSYGATVGISSNNDGKININTADETELIKLPGVGPATAQKIIDYRTTNGSFKSIEDIKKVSGIGDKKFEQIKDKIKVR